MEENIILKYRREFDCWVCDECDIENATTQETCVVCNAPKPVYATILKAWSPADEAPPPPTKRTPPVVPPKTPPRTPPAGPIFRGEPTEKYDYTSKSSGGGMTAMIWLIVLIVVFAILIAVNIK